MDWVLGILGGFCFSLGAQDLRLHPFLINFGSASRGREEANFDCFTGILFPFSNRRSRVTKLHLVICEVSNQVADWEGRTGGAFLNEGNPRTCPWVYLYFRVFLLSQFCILEGDEYREQTWL